MVGEHARPRLTLMESPRRERRLMLPSAALHDPKLKPSAFRMLACLGKFADSTTGWCHPKQRTLAAEMGISQQAVSAAIEELRSLGWVEVAPQYGPNGARLNSLYRVVWDHHPERLRQVPPQAEVVGVQPSLYRVDPPQAEVVSQAEVVPPIQAEVVTPTTSEVVTPTTSRGCSYNVPIERPNRNEQPTETTSPPVVSARRERAADNAEAKLLFDYYREKIQPHARAFKPEKIRARLKTFSADELRTGIDKFAADPWWMEHNAARGADWFFHSDQRSEQFLNLAPRKERRNGTHQQRNGTPPAGGATKQKSSWSSFQGRHGMSIMGGDEPT